MTLTRLTTADASWQSLESQWQNQCQEFDEDLRGFAGNRLDYAKAIASERPQDARYGIFGLKRADQWVAITHVNRAGLPGTEGWTLRLLWALLAPKFDYSDSVDEFPQLAALLVRNAISTARGSEMDCAHVKIHLGNLGDRAFFKGFATAIQEENLAATIAVRGNWLHIESVSRISV